MECCGLYKTIRKVLNLTGFHLLAAEYITVGAMAHISHTMNVMTLLLLYLNIMLAQLTDDVWAQFPVIVTLKYVCDVSVAMVEHWGTVQEL